MREHLVSHKMAEGGFDDMEMTERDSELRKYNDSQLQNEYDELSEKLNTLVNDFQGVDMPDVVRVSHDNIEDRMTLVRSELDRRREAEESVKKIQESSFTDDADGKTVTITRDGTSVKPPGEVPSTPGKHNVSTFKRLSTYDKKTFLREVLGAEIRVGDGPNSKNLLKRINVNIDDRSAEFDGVRIFVRKGRGIGLTENKKMKSKVEEFTKLLKDAESERGLQMVDPTPSASVDSSGISPPGSTPEEERELLGVLNPGPNTLRSTRIGDDEALQIQTDHYTKLLKEVDEERNNIFQKIIDKSKETLKNSLKARDGHKKLTKDVSDLIGKSRDRLNIREKFMKKIEQDRNRAARLEEDNDKKPTKDVSDLTEKSRDRLNRRVEIMKEIYQERKRAAGLEEDNDKEGVSGLEEENGDETSSQQESELRDLREREVELRDRTAWLENARDQTINQREREEVREIQEEDLTRLERFKEWMKDNWLGVSALAAGVAGLITTIIIGARRAAVNGAQATKSFAKAVRDAIKKLGPWAVPLANLIYGILKGGAAVLGWLASNLWVLVLALVWFVYDYYKNNRKPVKSKPKK